MSTALAMVVLTALTTVEHNGVLYGPGQPAGTEFEISEFAAAPLLDVKAAKHYKPSEGALAVVSLEEQKALLAAEAADLAAQRAQLTADQGALAGERNLLNSDKAELAFAKTKLETDQTALADARTKLDADQAAFDAAVAAKKK